MMVGHMLFFCFRVLFTAYWETVLLGNKDKNPGKEEA